MDKFLGNHLELSEKPNLQGDLADPSRHVPCPSQPKQRKGSCTYPNEAKFPYGIWELAPSEKELNPEDSCHSQLKINQDILICQVN
jgi:hypothetical protein